MHDDLDLLRRFARDGEEESFAELVRRHLNLVHSAAGRQVRSPQLAEEVAQSVFTDLARDAGRLKPGTVLAAWLYQVTRRTAIDVVRREARRQLREQVAVEMNAMNSTPSDWAQVEPLLDDAMAALDDTDRTAVLLRYFENKSLRDVGAALGTSDDTAQKRVSRAVDRLRDFFAQRGVTVGASGLAVTISTNAVQAAPIGLAAVISTASVLTGATLTTTATVTTTKAIAMTALQKTLVVTVLAATAGMGIHEARNNSRLKSEVQSLRQRQQPLDEQIGLLRHERDALARRLEAREAEVAQLQQNIADLPRLRGEVTQLQTAQQQQQAQSKASATDRNDPSVQQFLALKAQAMEISRHLEQRPDKKIPELKLLVDEDWLAAVKLAKFDTDADIRITLSRLRSLAKKRLPFPSALRAYTRANNSQLPADISELKPYLKSALGDASPDEATLDAALARYKLLHAGSLSDLPPNAWLIAEKAPVDKEYDTRAKFGNGGSTIISTGLGEDGDPDDKSY